MPDDDKREEDELEPVTAEAIEPKAAPKPAGAMPGGWPQVVVLVACVAGLVALACTHTLDLGSGAVLTAIAGAAGASLAKGKVPNGGAAVVVVAGLAALIEGAFRLRA